MHILMPFCNRYWFGFGVFACAAMLARLLVAMLPKKIASTLSVAASGPEPTVSEARHGHSEASLLLPTQGPAPNYSSHGTQVHPR
jgi:hypothetical protein